MSQQPPACVDSGTWTAVPPALLPLPTQPQDFTLNFQDVDPLEAARITTVQTFHLLGCTGDFSDQQTETAVAQAMAAQVDDPNCAVLVPNSPATHASFLFHLGDVVYKDDNKKDPEGNDQAQMYNDQFYAAYTSYRRSINGQSDFNCIFAIAGNHDGKLSSDPAQSAITHFVTNWCATPAPAPAATASAVPWALIRPKSPDNQTDGRLAMVQPYVYWRLDTPLAYIIGLYTNIANGGVLDDPGGSLQTQYNWLVAQLCDVGEKNATNAPRKAVVLALHYPPYSGATNFAQRGDPTLPNHSAVRPVGMQLQQAFQESGQRPDIVVSAHAHLYQRLTYRYAATDGPAWEIPYLIVGSGGHSPVEQMGSPCDPPSNGKKHDRPLEPLIPFAPVWPPGLTLPAGDSLEGVAYNDQLFGFLRLTIEAGPSPVTGEAGPQLLIGEFFTVDPSVNPAVVSLYDSFQLDIKQHQLVASGG